MPAIDRAHDKSMTAIGIVPACAGARRPVNLDIRQMASTVLETGVGERPHPLLTEVFAASAARYPSEIAIDIPPARGRPVRQTLTYAELDVSVQALSKRIAARIAGLDAPIVAILLPRSTPWLWTAQLAVLRAGGAYTCLDPAFPDARMCEVIEDAACSLLLTDADGCA